MTATASHPACRCATCGRLERNARRRCSTGRYALVADRCGDHEVVVNPEHLAA